MLILVEYDEGRDAKFRVSTDGFVMTSERKKYPNPRFYKRALKRLKRLQRSLLR